MAPSLESPTINALQEALLDSDTWQEAELLTQGAEGAASRGPLPTDAQHSSLELESSFLMRTGREPTNEEVMEYLEKHGLQSFLTDVVMQVAKHFPPDPFDFLLDHIEAMVMKHRAATGKTTTQPKLATAKPGVPEPSAEQRGRVVRQLALALQDQGSWSTPERLFGQFAKEEQLSEAAFGALLRHLEESWGLGQQDSGLMRETLRRWRFRDNAAHGTRGKPLWPLARQEFLGAYPSLLRAVRDRYVPIGSRVTRALFIKEAAGSLEGKYGQGPRLGRGAYGEVSLVTLRATGERRVCKTVALAQLKVPQEELLKEVEILRAMDHPHVMRVFEYFATEEALQLVMEPIFGGTLSQLVQGVHSSAEPEGLTEAWVATASAQLLSALAYAHDVKGVIHKDMKCDNVMIVAPAGLSPAKVLERPVHVVLADFGIAEVFQALPMAATHNHDLEAPPGHCFGSSCRIGRSTRVGGTPSYMSPEMFRGSFTAKSDVWSLGVVLFRLLTGELPYKGENLLMQAQKVCNPRRHPNWQLLQDRQWSLGARWFCQQLLSKDEGLRPSAAEALRDSWLLRASAACKQEAPTRSERQALQTQHLQSHLMRMAMACITSQLNLSQLHCMNARFRHYDSSGDGRLSHVEMRQVLADVGIGAEADKDLIVESLDGDSSGLIEYSEFVAGCLDLGSSGLKEELAVVFGIFDLDGSGAISAEELRSVLTEGPNSKRALAATGEAALPAPSLLPDGKTVEEVMRGLDLDGSRKVTLTEFQAYLLEEHRKAGSQQAWAQPP